MAVATPANVTAVDRLYARAVSFSVHAPEARQAVRELLQLAGSDPHQLGRARMLIEALVRERPDADHLQQGLALITTAWIESIELSRG